MTERQTYCASCGKDCLALVTVAGVKVCVTCEKILKEKGIK